jgi:cytochrome c-type biogenesis protein CcmH/NrfG
MGQAYLELGELEKALESFTKAGELMPGNSAIKKHIFQINAKIREENAKEHEFQKQLATKLVLSD